jgi:hypothetical protein
MVISMVVLWRQYLYHQKLSTAQRRAAFNAVSTASAPVFIGSALSLPDNLQTFSYIIAFNGNFHGRTMAPVSLSSEAEYQRGYGPLLDGLLHHMPNDVQLSMQFQLLPHRYSLVVLYLYLIIYKLFDRYAFSLFSC